MHTTESYIPAIPRLATSNSTNTRRICFISPSFSRKSWMKASRGVVVLVVLVVVVVFVVVVLVVVCVVAEGSTIWMWMWCGGFANAGSFLLSINPVSNGNADDNANGNANDM